MGDKWSYIWHIVQKRNSVIQKHSLDYNDNLPLSGLPSLPTAAGIRSLRVIPWWPVPGRDSSQTALDHRWTIGLAAVYS
jgi:hypothetical protein